MSTTSIGDGAERLMKSAVPRSRRLSSVLSVGAWGLVFYVYSSRSLHSDEISYYAADFPLLVLTGVLATVVSIANFKWGKAFLQAIRAPALVLGAFTFVTLLGLEVILRVFDPLGISLWAEMSCYILDRVPDPQLKFRHRTSFEARYQGTTMRFNDVGLRDDPIGPKGGSEYRILALGESRTLGWGVAREHTWPVRLQGILTQKLQRPVRVINAGCAGYETRQEYRYLLSDGYAFDPDLVLLMYVDDDLEINDRPFDPWSNAAFEGKSPGEILALLRRRTRVGQLPFFVRELIPILSKPSYEPEQCGLRRDFEESMREERGWKASMAALEGMKRSLEERGIKFAVVHFDWVTFPFSRAVNKAVRDVVAPSPVAYVPDWFEGQNVRQYFNSIADAHPNAEASRILAEHIADFISSQHSYPVM